MKDFAMKNTNKTWDDNFGWLNGKDNSPIRYGFKVCKNKIESHATF